MKRKIDLRSDTVTKPTEDMRQVMAEAGVGDDVFGEDPSVSALEEYSAHLVGKEAAIFVPSGTMGNLLATLSLVSRGQEVMMHEESHIYQHEVSGISAIAGAKPVVMPGPRGILSVDELEKHYHAGQKYWDEKTGLITIENTHNFCGGSVWTEEDLQNVAHFAKEVHIPIHMDGARIFNAAITSNMSVKKISSHVQSVMFCLSKGLGCPVGAMLCGPQVMIDKARRWRKMLGGGMRQVGILAAAGLYALKNHCNRLSEDHLHAQQLAQASRLCSRFLPVEDPETNILFLQTHDQAELIREELQHHGILCFATATRTLRLVTHLDVSQDDINYVCTVIQNL